LTRDDGKSKGTAFVKFSKKSSFNKAIELNGSEHLGRSLTIEESQKKNFNNGGNSFGQKGGFGNKPSFGAPQGNANIETPTLFIGGLSYNSTADSISSFFSQIGAVSSARVVTDK
jgi:nucleolin